MLEIKGVKKSYGEFQLDCSLNVEKGRITGLVGENGAGKSTVFKAVLGLISYDGGEIKILGKKPQELNEKEKEQMGVVLAEAGFSGYLKGKDVKAVLAKLYPKFEEEKFLQMCERYQIPLDKFLKEYSTGMKAKLNLIIALTHQADFLMLDEPTAGLDVGAREEMLDILRTYMEEEPERSILISSHISSDLEHLCDDIYVIHKGKIVLHEEMDRILEKYAMLKVSEEQYQDILEKERLIKEEIERVEHVNVGASKPVQELLEQYGSTPLTSGSTLGELIRRPELNYEALAPIDKNRPELRYDIREQVNINIKYDGYITRQLKQVEQFKKLESKKIPEDMDYDQVKSLRIEAVQKLKLYRPVSIGQASRIAGVSPADVSVLLVYLESHRV